MTQAFAAPIIGLDIGRSAVKVAYQHNGQRASFFFPSNVCLAQTIAHEETALAAKKETVTVDGVDYFTGDTARQQGGNDTLVGMSDAWVERPEYKALVSAALKKLADMGVPEIDNSYLIIGAPASVYEEQRTRLAEITNQVVNAHIRVLPQPSGAYYTHIYSPKGVPIPGKAYDSDMRLLDWAVIEVGHYTTDYIMVQQGSVIAKSFDSTEGIGTSLGNLANIMAEHKIKASDSSLTQAMISGRIRHFGKEIDVTELVQKAVAPVVQKITAKADELFDRDAASLDGVIVAGGGARYAYAPLREKWPHVAIMENPRIAVAEGFLRYGIATAGKVLRSKQPLHAA